MVAISSVWTITGLIILTRHLFQSIKKNNENSLLKKKSDSKIHFKEASEFFENKRYTEAIECYSKAISLYPIALYYNDRAFTYYFLDKIENAIEDYKNALRLGYTRSIPKIYETAGVRFDFSETYLKKLADFVGKELGNL